VELYTSYPFLRRFLSVQVCGTSDSKEFLNLHLTIIAEIFNFLIPFHPITTGFLEHHFHIHLGGYFENSECSWVIGIYPQAQPNNLNQVSAITVFMESWTRDVITNILTKLVLVLFICFNPALWIFGELPEWSWVLVEALRLNQSRFPAIVLNLDLKQHTHPPAHPLEIDISLDLNLMSSTRVPMCSRKAFSLVSQ